MTLCIAGKELIKLVLHPHRSFISKYRKANCYKRNKVPHPAVALHTQLKIKLDMGNELWPPNNCSGNDQMFIRVYFFKFNRSVPFKTNQEQSSTFALADNPELTLETSNRYFPFIQIHISNLQ